MRISHFSLAQKIAAAITIFSLCIALLLFFVLDFSQKKSVQDIAVRFIEASSRSMQQNLYKNHHIYQDIEKHLPHEYQEKSQTFWRDIVENSLTNLPPNFHAFIINQNAQIVSPKVTPHTISPQLLQKAVRPPFYTEARTINTAQGRVTYITRVLVENKYYLYMYYVHNNFQDILWARKNILMGVALAIMALGLVSAHILSRYLASPLQKLSTASQHLAHVDLFHESFLQALPALPTQRSDEIGTLARSFQHMAQTLQKNVRHTISLTTAHEKVESELRLAKSIQQHMLLQDFSSPAQDSCRIDMHGLVLPARDVGGDLFDIFWINDSKFCFIIGDVSDKGVPAALFMSMTLTLLRLLMRTPMLEHNPAKCLEYANNTLCQNNINNMFVTLIVGTMACTQGQIVYANAGHMPPICLHENQTVQTLPTHKEMVVASFEDIEYSNIIYNLTHGDRIFLYTDGVTDAKNSAGQHFGDANLHTVLQTHNTLSAQKLNEQLVLQIQNFSHGQPQYDDITVLNFLWQAKT